MLCPLELVQAVLAPLPSLSFLSGATHPLLAMAQVAVFMDASQPLSVRNLAEVR